MCIESVGTWFSWKAKAWQLLPTKSLNEMITSFQNNFIFINLQFMLCRKDYFYQIWHQKYPIMRIYIIAKYIQTSCMHAAPSVVTCLTANSSTAVCIFSNIFYYIFLFFCVLFRESLREQDIIIFFGW